MQTKQRIDSGSVLRLIAGTALWATDSVLTEIFLNKSTSAELERTEENYNAWICMFEQEYGFEACDRATTAIAEYHAAIQQQAYENGIKQGFKLAAELRGIMSA